MLRKISIITKKTLLVSLMVLVSFVMSLPRVQEAPHLRSSSLILSGTHSHGSEGVDSRLMKVRKFRRRRVSFSFNTHLSTAFLADPSDHAFERLMSPASLLFSRIPDPLVHPPA
jgi:hypothetical protein